MIDVQTLLDSLQRHQLEQPEATALVLVGAQGEETYSYRAFYEMAQRYAHALEAAGVRPGDLIVLVLEHGETVVFGFWGALLLGAVPSIFPFLTDKLDPERYYNSVRQLVEHENVRAVVTSPVSLQGLENALAGVHARLLVLDRLAPAGRVGAPGTVRREDTAFLQHSSGSTGLQKGVMLSHGAVLNQIDAYSRSLSLTRDDVVVSWLPLYHDMGLIAGFVMPLVFGVKLVLMSPFQWVRDPKILLHAIHRHRGTLCWLPNFAYNFLATRVRDQDLNGVSLATMRAFINCSEPVYHESHRLFGERYAPYGVRPEMLQVCYAMAENTFAVTQTDLGAAPTLDIVDRRLLMEERCAQPAEADQASVTLVSCGRPIDGCEVQVVDETRQPLAERRVGEVALRSNSMLSGYYARPDLTAEALAGGWYFTGDMGYLADGELFITGRKKDLVIVGGKNLYPQDVETLLNTIEGVHPGRVVAFGVPNEALGTEDIGVVAEVEDGVLADDEWRGAILREARARVVQNLDVTLRYVHLVDSRWLLKTSSGKIARGANRDKFLAEQKG